jgi:tetratricopeptide (TPR) repeat protein
VVDRAVFINYRSEDSASNGAWLYTELAHCFGDEHVFLDAESIPAGADFVEELLRRVRSARILLAVIGPHWLTATDPTGRRRIDDPADWIRREVAEAFTAGIRVIPVLTDQAELPRESELPADIAALSRSQYRHLRRREPTSDLARIVTDLTTLDPILAAAARSRDNAPRPLQTGDVHGGLHVHAPPGPVRPALRQLPADTALFTGRDDELGRLLALVERARTEGSPGTVVISAIDGMGGIGKTALAIRAAHRLAGRFPDGQLFIDLYGFTQGTAPRDPGDALVMLLSSLGVSPGLIPADLDARAALYRDRLADTRTLILLDNAADEAQVRPLLPAADTCLVLITSRRRLKALDDALPLPLDVLAPGEAVALLRKAARLDDHQGDKPLLARVTELCGRLPLALLIAGALLRTGGKAWNLPVLIDRLAAQQPGRELAGYTDETRSVAAVFDLSYRNLPADQQLLFRRLGLLPGPEIDAYAAAALLATDLDEAGRLLQRLADHSLLAGACPGRYRLHDLVRAHARTVAVTLDPAPERQAAERRLLHYYAHTAQTASQPIARLPRPGPHGHGSAHVPDLTDPDAARAWLRIEYPNLEAAHTHASTHVDALDGHAIALAAGLAEILQTDGPWTRALEIHQAAADLAAHRQQPTAQAAALTDLARIRFQTGDYARTADANTRALEISHRIGDHLGEANALYDLARLRYMTGDYGGAADANTRALEIYRRIGDRRGEAGALNNLGRLRYMTGDYPRAADAIMRALEIPPDREPPRRGWRPARPGAPAVHDRRFSGGNGRVGTVPGDLPPDR